VREPWWKQGLRFECTGRGCCCVTRGQSSFVYVTLEDRRRLARHLGLSTSTFTRRYCVRPDGFFQLKDRPGTEACIFLEGRGCLAYPARPTQCRTWPFWPQTLESPEVWKEKVLAVCPGAGRGRLWSAEEIARARDEQEEADRSLT